MADGALARWPDAGGATDPWGVVSRGGLHEWFAGHDEGEGRGTGRGPWVPPMAVLIGLAREAIGSDPWRRVVWVGRRCWPYPPAMALRDGREEADQEGGAGGDRRLLERSVFVDTPETRAGHAERVWAIELAVRCPGVCAVVADGTGLTMAESRRLQLASAASEKPGVPLLLARPPRERRALSAARTRWRVLPLPPTTVTGEENDRQGWSVELLRCKGVRPDSETEGARRWAARRAYATGHITMEPGGRPVAVRSPITGTAGDGGVAAQVGDGPGAAHGSRIA